MTNWMILGGGGVFGMHVARHLLVREKVNVVAVGRNPFPTSEWTLGCEGFGRFRYEQIHVLHETRRLFALMEEIRPEVIINFAALAYATSWEDSDRYYETNVVALARMTEWLTGKGWLDRFVQIGTSELYGSRAEPATEDAPLRPTSPYAVSKMAADLHLQTMKGFPFVILRPSNAYGEAQQLYRIVPRAAWCAVNGQKLPLNGGGLVEKSYIHAEDLARAVVTVATAGRVGTVYNAGPDQPMTIRGLVECVARAANTLPSDLITEAPPRANEDARYVLNSDRIRALGWKPSVTLDDGIHRVVDWVNRYVLQLPQPREFVLRV